MLSEAQKKARIGKMTSSVVAGALGFDPRSTPLQTWLKITGRESFDGNKATERGNRLEDLILDYPCEVHALHRGDAPFRKNGHMPWAGDSVDATYYEDHDPEPGSTLRAIGEGKSASLGIARGYGEEGTDDIPETALIQSHWHLIHWPEVDVCFVPVLVGGWAFEFRLYEVKRNPEMERKLVTKAHAWWERYVKTDNPPPADAGDEPSLRALFPEVRRPELTYTDPTVDELVTDLAQAQAAKRAAELRESAIKAKLMERIGEHEGVEGPWGRILWRPEQGSVSWKKVAEELGATNDVIEKHRGKPRRVFRPKLRGTA